MAEPISGEAPPSAGSSDPADEGNGERAQNTLVDAISALISDARAYVDAELAFQKSRAAFAAGRIKLVLICVLAAVFLALLSTVALAVGLVLALTPLLTAWGAMAVVVLALLLIAALLLRTAIKAWASASGEFKAVQEGNQDA